MSRTLVHSAAGWNGLPDPSDLGRVAVLMGGASAEREVSLMSGQGVLAALRSVGVNAEAFDPAQGDLGDLRRQGFDRAFIALHGRFGEDGTVQGALELLGIPYTGSGVLASALAIDKVRSKSIWLAQGLPTPPFVLARSVDAARSAIATLGLPLAVKPCREGSSIGFAKVEAPEQLAPAFEQAAVHDPEVLIERFISGPELTVAILGEGDAAIALPPIEIRAQGQYDYHNKYFSDDTRYLCPAPLDAKCTEQLVQCALAAYRALGCTGWGRVDLMLDQETQRPWLLEVNTSPGMTAHSLVPMAAQAAGLDYAQLCLAILGQASLKLGASPVRATDDQPEGRGQ